MNQEITNYFALPLFAKNPSFALVGYESSNSTPCLRFFPITDNTVHAEIPFSKETAKAIFSFFEKDNAPSKPKFKGLIPSNLLWYNHDGEHISLVWHTNSQKKYLQFKENIGIESGFYFIPKQIFILKDNTLFVFSVKKEPLNLETNLYNAPFLNVYEDGSVCMGNVKMQHEKFGFIEDVMTYTENAFFNSIFTHTNHSNIINGNLVSYLKDIKNTNTHFDENLLLNTKLTLKTFIK